MENCLIISLDAFLTQGSQLFPSVLLVNNTSADVPEQKPT